MVNFSSFRRGGVNLRSRTKSLTKSYAAQSDKVMSENWDNGFITDEEYVSYLQGEVAGRAWLTPSQKTANKIKTGNVQERIAETAYNDAYENGTISTTDYIGYKQRKLSGMTEGSLAYRNLQQDIYGLEDRIVEEQEQERTRMDAENKRLRNLQYSANLLTISEWQGDTLSKARGKVLALEGLVKDMEEYGDTVDDEGLPAKEYLSAQTRLNNAVETSTDLFRQEDQLRQELALNLSDLDTIPDLEGKRAIAEQMLQNAIESQDEMAYLRVANRIATIDDSLRNAYESEAKRAEGRAEKDFGNWLRMEKEELQNQETLNEQLYQDGDISAEEYLANKQALIYGSEEAMGQIQIQQIIAEDPYDQYTPIQRSNASQEVGELQTEVERITGKLQATEGGTFENIRKVDTDTWTEERDIERLKSNDIVWDKSKDYSLQDVLKWREGGANVYIRDENGDLRPLQFEKTGMFSQEDLDAMGVKSESEIKISDIFNAGGAYTESLTDDGLVRSKYDPATGSWATFAHTGGNVFDTPYAAGTKSPHGINVSKGAGMIEAEGGLIEEKTHVRAPAEPTFTQRIAEISRPRTELTPRAEMLQETRAYKEKYGEAPTGVEAAAGVGRRPVLKQEAVETMKTPEYKEAVEAQIARPWGQEITPQPLTEFVPPRDPTWKVPEKPERGMSKPWETMLPPGKPTMKTKDVMATMPYQRAVQTQAEKAVKKGVPYESTLAGYQEQKKKKTKPWYQFW